ncbi:MAG: glutaredoxin domain-containing protein [Fidelibacterota bacterium]
MATVRVFSTSWCSYCRAAKRLLSGKGVDFQEIDIEKEGISREELARITGGSSVPQIVIGNRSVGGYEDLLALDRTGKLEELLNKRPVRPAQEASPVPGAA